jgi:hypothetical protein
MTPRKAISQLAKMVGRDLRRGKPSENAFATGPLLAGVGATVQVLDGLFAEARRKHPNDELIQGYAFILQSALDSLRIDANGGVAEARQSLEEVRQAAEQAVTQGDISGAVLMLVGRAFTEAELDPGRTLQEALMGAIESDGATEQVPADAKAMSEQLAKLAKALDDDPFAIHAELAQTGAVFPAEHRAALAASFAAWDIPTIREAAIGFALDTDREVAAAVLAVLANSGPDQTVSSAMVNRLVHIRPWLTDARRSELDAAIRALRPKAGPPIASPRAEIRTVLASMGDGSGAQSLFAIVKRGRSLALTSVLVKFERGVADAWVRDGMTKAEADDTIEDIVTGTDAVEVSIGMLERRISDALTVNLKHGAPPPFGLLQVTETLGLGSLQPQAVSAAKLVNELLADLPPAVTDARAQAAARRASADWIDEIGTIRSWFEAGEAVDTLLQPIKTRRKRIEAVLTQYLPTRRLFWAERCAWTAFMIKGSSDDDPQHWIAFALVARDFVGDQPLDTMPIARLIAETSVDAFAGKTTRVWPAAR